MSNDNTKEVLLKHTNNRIIELQRELNYHYHTLTNIDNDDYIVIGDWYEQDYRLVTIGDNVMSKYGDTGVITDIKHRDGGFPEVTMHCDNDDETRTKTFTADRLS